MTIFIILLCCIIALNANIFEPELQLHDRRQSFLITCNGSSITGNVLMFFNYGNKSYTVPRTNNEPGVYIGNFSAVSTDQSKVMVICKDLNNGEFLGSKIYLLGYPPSFISQHYQLSLNCRDFNLMRMVCCLTPNVSAIEQLLGFEDYQNGEFQAKLYFADNEKEVTVNKSCYELTKQTLAPTTSLHVVIKNVLGKDIHNFTIDRLAIQKPNTPKYFLSRKDTSFNFLVDLYDYGEYNVDVSCISSSPIIISKTFSFKMSGIRSDIISSVGWAPNSKIVCTFTAKVWFGKSTVGQSSDPLSISLTLLEGKPSCGPYVSSMLVDYDSFSDDGTIYNLKVYYTNVALVDRNGIIIKYQWKCDNCFLKNRSISNVVHEISAVSRTLRLDHAIIGSNLSMTACTAKGCSPSWNILQFQRLKDISTNRRLSVTRNPKNPSNLTIVWYEDGNEYNPLFLLVCTYTSKDNECSSIDRINLNENSKHYLYFQVDELLEARFALVSHRNNSNNKLKWVSCFYNSLSMYETEKKLQKLNYGLYINWTMDCGFHECQINYIIRIPKCEEFPDVFFRGFNITYHNNQGAKVSTVFLQSEQTVNLILTNFSSGRNKYLVQISVMTMDNTAFPWFHNSHTTDFWSPFCLSIIVIVLSILFFIVFIISCLIKMYIGSQYRKQNDRVSPMDRITVNNNVTHVTLLNTENKNVYADCAALEVIDKHSLPSSEILRKSSRNYSRPSSEKCSTSSTSFDASYSSHDSSEERLVDIAGNDSKPYCPRPSLDVGVYSHIAFPTKINEKISSIPSECIRIKSDKEDTSAIICPSV